MWTELCGNVEDAMTTAKNRWERSRRRRTRPKGSASVCVEETGRRFKAGQGSRTSRLRRLWGRLSEAAAQSRAVAKGRLGPRALQNYLRLVEQIRNTQIAGFNLTEDWEADCDRLEEEIQKSSADAAKRRLATWKNRMQGDPATLKRWISNTDGGVRGPSIHDGDPACPTDSIPASLDLSGQVLEEHLGPAAADADGL